jgi:DNA replication and repair protein RecF
MYVERAVLINFRNYRRLNIEFSKGVNFIVGRNGAGKSNILEAISVASTLRSFRNAVDNDIVMRGETSYYCCSSVMANNETKFEVGCSISQSKLRKKVKIDDNEIKRSSDYYGRLLSVVFFPFDINILTGPNDNRRKYFDSIISKVDREYLKLLVDFKRILSSRNRILSDLKYGRIKNSAQLNTWDEMFSKAAGNIAVKRNEFINSFKQPFMSAYSILSSFGENVSLMYVNSMKTENEEEILNVILNSRQADIERGFTGRGPQRDDYRFINENGEDFNRFASQGQKRTASISLKIAEGNYIEKKTNKKPVVLVDDILSELDEERRKNLLDYLKNCDQVIFTMINSGRYEIGFNDSRRYIVNAGGVVEQL